MRVTSDDAQIDVRIDGPRQAQDRNGGDAIVLLAGFPMTREIWDEQALALCEKYRVVRPDLRGMGASSVPDGPYLMEVLAGDVAAVLDTLGIDRATIVGHSLGGYVALAFARMYAERVARLALVCSRLSADSAERARWRNEVADEMETTGNAQSHIDEMIDGLLAKPELTQRARAIAQKNTPRGLAAMQRGMALRDPADDIAPDLAMPVLVLAGAADRSLSLEEARATVAAFPHATLVVSQVSGHLPMLEDPGLVTSALAELMARPSG